MEKLENILIDIQDKLVPNLDSYEQAIYHYLFRHTYLIGEETCLFSARTADIGLGTGDNSKQPSAKTRSKKLQSLKRKGCIQILERSNKGTSVRIILPNQMPSIQNRKTTEPTINMEDLDFYKDRRLLESILEREGYRCFYTGRKIVRENCYLDHVIPQARSGDNSYKNIVATCYDANSMKNDRTADEFARSLYKDEIISISEFKELNVKIQKLQAGELVPNHELVRAAINTK